MLVDVLPSGLVWCCFCSRHCRPELRVVGAHACLNGMVLTLLCLLEMDLPDSSPVVTLVLMTDNLYIVPMIELYIPLVRKMT